MAKIDIHIIDKLKAVTDDRGWSQAEDELAPHLEEWRGRWRGKTPLLLKPSSSEEISQILKICNKYGCRITPQGGNTGLVDGGLPSPDGDEILLSTKRLNKYISVDDINNTITADAGVTVQQLQEAASESGRLFPLSLASEGSCTVGGILSTNAGGVHVLRYGNTRDLALGIEAALPSGEIISALTGLRKDNTGYNLSQLLIGAEGTLGIITKATFKLYPAIQQTHMAMVGLNTAADAIALLQSTQKFAGQQLSAFELMPYDGLSLVLNHIPGTVAPFETTTNWLALIEIGLSTDDDNFSVRFENWLEGEMLSERIIDGTIAQNQSQCDALWKLRESMSEAQRAEGASIKHDISLPISVIADFLKQATDKMKDICPDVRPIPFGHLGDGNLHYNLSQPVDMDPSDFMAHEDKFNDAVYDIVCSFGGSISAEHGIGRLKVNELEKRKSPAELTAMKAIKRAIDPNSILNIGRILK